MSELVNSKLIDLANQIFIHIDSQNLDLANLLDLEARELAEAADRDEQLLYFFAFYGHCLEMPNYELLALNYCEDMDKKSDEHFFAGRLAEAILLRNKIKEVEAQVR